MRRAFKQLHVGISTATSLKPDARGLSRRNLNGNLVKTRRKRSLTLEFHRYHQQNPTQGAYHVGISTATSSKPDARGSLRWNFIAIISKTRRKRSLTLEFQRQLSQNPTQEVSYVGISTESSAKADARGLSRRNLNGNFVKSRRKGLITLEFQRQLRQNPTQEVSPECPST